MSDYQNIVIIGASQAGHSLANALVPNLPTTHRILLVDALGFAFWPIAALRAAVAPGWEKCVTAPLNTSTVFPSGTAHQVIAPNKVLELGESAIVLKKPFEGSTELPCPASTRRTSSVSGGTTSPSPCSSPRHLPLYALSVAGDADLQAMALQRLYNAGLDKGDKAFGVDARHLLLWSDIGHLRDGDLRRGERGRAVILDADGPGPPNPGQTLSPEQAISLTAKAVSVFLAAGLCYFGIPPRICVGVFAFGAFVTTLLAMVLPQGSAALAMPILITFFESPLFQTIFAIIIGGQGNHLAEHRLRCRPR